MFYLCHTFQMAGVYIHIPFCHKACTYCDFHFSTSLRTKQDIIKALLAEITLRKNYLNETVETIYFGGGTPSILTSEEINQITECIVGNFNVQLKECTLEANPEDLTLEYIRSLKSTLVNRLSIGVQSFKKERLSWMNRTHSPEQAKLAIKKSLDDGFIINADLIFALPEMTINEWHHQLEILIGLNPHHISAYSLTLESHTLYDHQVQKKLIKEINDDEAELQFLATHQILTLHGYNHYEISNYAVQGYEALHNSNYWKGKSYIGIGPSAHSYDGKSRQWNVRNNALYLKNIAEKEVFYEREILDDVNCYNEYVMTGLRTADGLDVEEWEKAMPDVIKPTLLKEKSKMLRNGFLKSNGSSIFIPIEYWYRADSIISMLFAEKSNPFDT